jgi:hypothetical protein
MDNNNEMFHKLLSEAQTNLISNNILYSNLISDREKVIKFYVKRINKVQKRIRSIGNAVKREESRIRECKKMLGMSIDTIQKGKVIVKESIEPIDKFAINPITGEVIELSYDEINQLLEDRKKKTP